MQGLLSKATARTLRKEGRRFRVETAPDRQGVSLPQPDIGKARVRFTHSRRGWLTDMKPGSEFQDDSS